MKKASQSGSLVSSSDTPLAKPGDITLEGNVRTEKMSSPLGTINLRWPRKVELLFGRNPMRAMADTARTVSRAVKGAGFPSSVQTINLEWQVVFMDEELPETQIPRQLISNCHPGWMTPPANIYIVAQRVAAGCGGGAVQSKSSVADEELARVLIHEMGHAVEYHILTLDSRIPMERMRAEGFATWFTQYAAGFSSIVNAGSVKEYYRTLAQLSLQHSPDSFVFAGSGYDYARASMYFKAVVRRRGVRGLMDIYDLLKQGGLQLIPAITESMGWSAATLEDEVKKAAASTD